MGEHEILRYAQSSEYLVFTNLILIFFLKLATLLVGFLTVHLGYKLLVAGIKGEFKFSGRCLNNHADLASASPGLLFLLLGILLMSYSLFTDKSVPISYKTKTPASVNGSVMEKPYVPKNIK